MGGLGGGGDFVNERMKIDIHEYEEFVINTHTYFQDVKECLQQKKMRTPGSILLLGLKKE